MSSIILTKAQAAKFAEGYNLYVERHNAGLPSLAKSPRGTWISFGYEEVRVQMLERQFDPEGTEESIMAPFAPITAADAQSVWGASEIRLQAAIAKYSK